LCLFGQASRVAFASREACFSAKRSVLLSKSTDFLTFEVASVLLKIIPNLPSLILTNYKKTAVYKPLTLLPQNSTPGPAPDLPPPVVPPPRGWQSSHQTFDSSNSAVN